MKASQRTILEDEVPLGKFVNQQKKKLIGIYKLNVL